MMKFCILIVLLIILQTTFPRAFVVPDCEVAIISLPTKIIYIVPPKTTVHLWLGFYATTVRVETKCMNTSDGGDEWEWWRELDVKTTM